MSETNIDVGSYGVHDTMKAGSSHALSRVIANHPLEKHEQNFHKIQEQREMKSTRDLLGIHMPIKLQMERTVASKIRRLPGLPSSQLALRTLMDCELAIGPEDLFNDVSLNLVDYQALGDKYMGI